jgi:hypothetical protein
VIVQNLNESDFPAPPQAIEVPRFHALSGTSADRNFG